jgi:hypothetical protein
MAAFTSKATGNWDSAGQTTWNEVGTPGAGDTVTIQNTHNVSLTQAEAATSVTVDSGGTLTQSTYNLVLSGAFDLTGTHIMGTSADTGLTCASYTENSGSSRDWQQESIVNCGGDYIINTGATSVNNYRGILTLTGSGNLKDPTSNHRLWELYQNAGVTTTLTGLASLSNSSVNVTNLSGIWVLAGFELHLGVRSFSTFTLGANADFTGNGNIVIVARDTTNFVINRTTAFSFLTGTIKTANGSQGMPCLNTPNADWELVSGATPRTTTFKTGTNFDTLYCKNFTTSGGHGNNVIDNSENPDFNVSGNIDFTEIATYTKGTGNYILSGTSGTQTILGNGKTLEEVNINCAGATKQWQDGMIFTGFEIIAGIVDANNQTLVSAGKCIIPDSDNIYQNANNVTITATGNVSNPNLTNKFLAFAVTAGTATLTGDVICNSMTNIATIAGTGAIHFYHPSANNFITAIGTYASTGGIKITLNAARSLGAINLPNIDMYILTSASILTTTGLWKVKNLDNAGKLNLLDGEAVNCFNVSGAGAWTSAGTESTVKYDNSNTTSGSITNVVFQRVLPRIDFGGFISNAEVMDGAVYMEDITPTHVMTWKDTITNIYLGVADKMAVDFNGTPDHRAIFEGALSDLWLTSAGKLCVTNRPANKQQVKIKSELTNLNVATGTYAGCLAVNTSGTATTRVYIGNKLTNMYTDGSGNLMATASIS